MARALRRGGVCPHDGTKGSSLWLESREGWGEAKMGSGMYNSLQGELQPDSGGKRK